MASTTTAAGEKEREGGKKRAESSNDDAIADGDPTAPAADDLGLQPVPRRRIRPVPPQPVAAPNPPLRRNPDPRRDPEASFLIVYLLVMTLFFFLITFILLTGPGFKESSPARAAAEGVQVTYGSVIKLMHEKTECRLHSHDVPYGSGSGQQSVTGFPNVDDSNSCWIVRPEPDSSAKQGDVITTGTIIRLQHMRTRKWLHSHLHASPITGNLEVSCFGGDHESDTGDFWRLEIEGKGKTWRKDQRIRLKHVDTGGYLHSHDRKYTRIAGGQQEVCGVREKQPDNVWLATEGVYLPVSGTK